CPCAGQPMDRSAPCRRLPGARSAYSTWSTGAQPRLRSTAASAGGGPALSRTTSCASALSISADVQAGRRPALRDDGGQLMEEATIAGQGLRTDRPAAADARDAFKVHG